MHNAHQIRQLLQLGPRQDVARVRHGLGELGLEPGLDVRLVEDVEHGHRQRPLGCFHARAVEADGFVC